MKFYELEKEVDEEIIDSQICLPEEFNDAVEIENLPMHQTKTEVDDFQSPSNLAWEKARLIDKQRAWSKFHILKRFINYRLELKEKGVNFDESGKSFVKKLNRGEICFEDFIKLKVSVIALMK